jgi:hypothetical protein
MDSLAPPGEISSPMVHALFLYWQRKRAGRLAPMRADIEPGDIKRLLPFVCLSEVTKDPFDVRFRLVGTSLVEATGYDFTGRRLREMPLTTNEDVWIGHYKRIVSEQRPFYGRYRAEFGAELVRSVDHGAFPLSTDGTAIDRIIEVEDWSEIRGGGFSKPDHPRWRFEPLEIG